MSNSCEKIKIELVECIKDSPCWNSNKTFGECLRSNSEEELTKRCINVRNVYRECKRGQLDMRYRFRGNPFATLPPDKG